MTSHVLYLDNSLPMEASTARLGQVHQTQIDRLVGLGAVSSQVLHRPAQQRFHQVVVILLVCFSDALHKLVAVNCERNDIKAFSQRIIGMKSKHLFYHSHDLSIALFIWFELASSLKYDLFVKG